MGDAFTNVIVCGVFTVKGAEFTKICDVELEPNEDFITVIGPVVFMTVMSGELTIFIWDVAPDTAACGFATMIFATFLATKDGFS